MNASPENRTRLPGVDMAEARERLFDDEAFLINLLGEFVRHGLSIEDSLDYELRNDNVGEALRKVHQLRGGAANLAARSIEKKASTLETALSKYSPLKPDREEQLERIEGLRSELREELRVLRNALLRNSAPAEPPPESHRRGASLPAATPPQLGRVLVIDDSDAMRSYLRVTLEKELEHIEVLEATDGLGGYRALLEQKPDLALCDLQMPQFDGMKLLTMRATRPELKEIPIIMLTAEHEMERKVEVLNRGAADYITKPFHGQELIARVKIHLGLKQLKDKLHQANAKLEKLATTDPLTQLFNRRQFDLVLREELERTNRYGTPLSLIMIDLDRFKSVNDTYGHAMGDAVLVNVGQLLLRTVRATDRACRFGGEELAVILPHTGEDGARVMAERIRATLEKTIHRLDETEIKCTASLGIASADGERFSPQQLVAVADRGLYAAKSGGRNRVVPASKLEELEMASGGQ